MKATKKAIYAVLSGSDATDKELITAVTMRFNPQKRWRKVQELISRVWSRWLKEYLLFSVEKRQ